MAERLTRNNKVNFYFHDEASNMVYYKLQKLEDIMEKYHCNDIEELEKKLADSDTWQKACELACEYMCKFVIPCPDIHRKECKSFCDLNKADCYQDYFYQQAKTEGNDE